MKKVREYDTRFIRRTKHWEVVVGPPFGQTMRTCMYAYMTLLFILVTLAHFHFVLVVETVPYSGALGNCRDCDVIE
jgi:hypothetical protein